MILTTLPPPGWDVPRDRIIATNNGHTCDVHYFGCENLLLLVRLACCCGVLLHLNRTAAPDDIAAYFVLRDSDGSWVSFALWEHAVLAPGGILDRIVVRLFEMYTPEQPNFH